MDNPQQCGLYSLRSGGTLAGANNGVSDRLISKQRRWSSTKLRNGYIKESTETKLSIFNIFLAAIYLLKVNNINSRTRCEICSKLTIKTAERRSGVFIVNYEHISHLVLAFLLLTFNK